MIKVLIGLGTILILALSVVRLWFWLFAIGLESACKKMETNPEFKKLLEKYP